MNLHVAGWVRTRRDSKAFSFLELNDGTCLGNLQIVADAGIPGYESISKMNTGASVEVRGKLIPSPAAGQAWEMQASSLKLLGEVPGRLSAPEKRPQPGVPARHRPPPPAHESLRRGVPHAQPDGLCRSTSFSRSAISSTSTRRSSPPAIARGPGKCSASPPCRTTRSAKAEEDFFGKRAYLTVSGQLEGRNLRLRPFQHLHLRPHLPRGKLQHLAPRRRVLDDRAGDGVLRSGRRHGSRGGAVEISRPAMPSKTARATWRFFEQVRGQGPARAARVRRQPPVRADHLHRGRRAFCEKAARPSNTRSNAGCNLQSEHER